MNTPKVALVHDYLVQYGGAEKTLEAIIELFPEAPIFTSVYAPKNFSGLIGSKKVITPKLTGGIFSRLPSLTKFFTFLNPLVFESFDLSEYDLIISDSSSYAKGVLTKPGQLHISYIHTPPRFLYKYSVENTKRTSWYFAPFVGIIDHFLRMWDYSAAQRPNFLVANSHEIQNRIRKFYHREATIIHPPVELANNHLSGHKSFGGKPYFLAAGRLVAYKNFDLIIRTFKKLPQLELYLIGSGGEEKRLRRMAGGNVRFLGQVTDDNKHEIMENCLGLINAVQDEDFGIVPIEVLSHGHPVLAHKSAGHLETVQEGVNGMFFTQLTEDHLADKVREFYDKIKAGAFDTQTIINSIAKFSKENFKHDFYEFVMDKWNSRLA